MKLLEDVSYDVAILIYQVSVAAAIGIFGLMVYNWLTARRARHAAQEQERSVMQDAP